MGNSSPLKEEGNFLLLSPKGPLLEPDQFHKKVRPRLPPVSVKEPREANHRDPHTSNKDAITAHAQGGPRVSLRRPSLIQVLILKITPRGGELLC